MSGRAARRIYDTARWAIVRRAALDRDGWRCGRCGKPGRLEVHHLTRIVDGGAPFDLRNLECLCRPCHFEAHGQAAPRLSRVVRASRRAWRRFALGGV